MNILRPLLVGLLSAFFVACASITPTPPATLTLAATTTPLPPVQLRVLPKTLRPGMRATMVGFGFDRYEPVAFYLIRPDGTKTSEGDSTADKTGGAAYELDVMDDWQPGQYVVRVQSRNNPSRHAEQKIELLRR